jgi:dolichyl-phosphate beta-glucosyltransferase
MARTDLSIVIPAFNEVGRLPGSLDRIVDFLEAHQRDFEVLVVDDGSRDGTAEVAESRLARIGDRGRVLRNPRNLGKGASVRHGMLAARGALVLFTDADLSAPIEELAKLEQAIAAGAGVAIGSRAVDRHLVEERQPWTRDVIGRVFNLLVQLSAVRGIHDTQCGFKLFRADVARTLFREARVDRFAYDVEILYLARRRGLAIAEVPVVWINSPESKVSVVRDSLRMLWDVLWIRWMHRGRQAAA